MPFWKPTFWKPDPATYTERRLLTNPEQLLYWRLHEALPECIILTQVELSRVIQPQQDNFGAFQRINGKSLDFVVCLRDSTIVAAIELDDSSHRYWKRMKADATKNAALKDAGVTLLRWNVRTIPTAKEIRRIFTT